MLHGQYLDLLLISTVLAAAFIDLRERRIPNWLTYSALLMGALMQATFGEIGAAATGFLAALGGGLLLYLARVIGGGDVKFLCAIGVMAGAALILQIAIWSFFVGSLVGVILIVKQKGTSKLIGETVFFLKTLLYSGVRPAAPAIDITVPFGAIIAFATCMVLAGVRS